ncbi:hypothetical protein LJC14_06470 [Treponema sp. OttesenSCG-928-L16]|nr:hypothetical protein [Treponema sp. OttesenSCG-928-L16]
MNEAIPKEYRGIAEALFPPQGFAAGKGPSVKAACDFAEILGIGADYDAVLKGDKINQGLQLFLGHFQNNLNLLIQKTWVEKADEIRKEKLLDQVPDLIAEIEAGSYKEALSDFSTILEELAYLFFGAQSKKDDFTEYALRIDTQMGLFWWYGAQIGCLCDIQDDQILRAILLIGICYLTNF